MSTPNAFQLLTLAALLLLAIGNLHQLACQKQQQQPLYQNATQLSSSTPASTTSKPNYLETGRQITGILDKFMSLGYDKRVRPNYGGPPVEVNVTMRILSISSVSEVMMDFTADFYFRQTWHDPRLSFKKLGDIQTLYVGAEVSKKIWLPDTFFGNEKLAYFHEATTPNVFLRIDHSGEVYRSIRLTVTSSCPMNLQYFPMDRQRCTIEAESYGYNVKDIIYRWARDLAVERDKEISLPQFDIVKTVQKYRLEELSSGTYSRLIAEIHFARRMGYYLIQIYIPSSLIVVISWVSFWLHRNASPARVQLGVTTVLTMTTLMSSTNAALPKISYVKSIDIFLGTCFIMVFAALLEYATVGYLGKRIAMRKAQLQHAQSQAQAKIWAQLQAQGAQGDPIPPVPSSSTIPIFGTEPITSSSAAVAAAAAANAAANAAMLAQTGSSPTIFGGSSGVNGGSNGFNASGGSVLEAVQQASLIQQLAAGFSQQAAANEQQQAAERQRQLEPPSPPPRSCHHHDHNHTCAHHHNHNHQQQQQKHRPTCSVSHVAQENDDHNSCTCRHQSISHMHHNHHSHNRDRQHSTHHLDELEDRLGCLCLNAQTLPRNITFANQRLGGKLDKQEAADNRIGRGGDFHPMRPPPPPPPLVEGGLNTCCSPPSCLNNLQGNDRRIPPHLNNINAYNQGKAKSPSAAATAATATFINMHRRNKGLPPSTNPNFSQFAWMGANTSGNRSIETIFGIRPSDIDKYSRVIFPVCFVCFQLMYWIVYLHISAFLEGEQQNKKQ